MDHRRSNRQKLLVVDAVQVEPVSATNSLLTGKFTKFGLSMRTRRPVNTQFQWLPERFPSGRTGISKTQNREIIPTGEQNDRPMSASLIGRLGSSAFRLPTTTVSMSLAGSCFSSESAPRPFHHGIRRRGGTIFGSAFGSALPSVERQVQADIRTHLIHRPARDIIPPLGGARVSSYRL
jgi:hypothetical protein